MAVGAKNGFRRVPGAGPILGAIGLLVLFAYILSGQVREAVLTPVWQLEAFVAAALGITVRPSASADSAVDPLVAAAVILAYGAVTIYISKRLADNIPSAAMLTVDASGPPEPFADSRATE